MKEKTGLGMHAVEIYPCLCLLQAFVEPPGWTQSQPHSHADLLRQHRSGAAPPTPPLCLLPYLSHSFPNRPVTDAGWYVIWLLGT